MSTADIIADDHSVTVSVDTDVAPGDLFAVLADPRRHNEIDGSGMLQGADPTSPVPITAVGEIFSMRMHSPTLGDYRTDNHVVEFVQDRAITWTTAREGDEPAGVWWSWRLEPTSDGGTCVTHRYDWSRVTDAAVLARVTFPRVQPAELEQTVERLIAATTR